MSSEIVVAVIAGVAGGGFIKELVGAARARTLSRRDDREGGAALLNASSAYVEQLQRRLAAAEARLDEANERLARLEDVYEAERVSRREAEDLLDAERDRRIRAEMERDQLAAQLADLTA